MKNIKIAILGSSDIAERRFLPALMKERNFQYVGLASRFAQKADRFKEKFGGQIFDGYDSAIENKDIDSLYIPLPPSLHFEYALKALKKGKHIFIEKPLALSERDTTVLINMAKEKELAIMENYAFLYHPQTLKIKNLIEAGEIGKIRLYRFAFGFPMRKADDFRYNKTLGGGALFDCGGYAIRGASHFLGADSKIKTASLLYEKEFEVDISGSAVLENSSGIGAQIAFGMDNAYKCEMEIWGSNGIIYVSRLFTAPSDFKAQIKIIKPDGEKFIDIEPADQFQLAIKRFAKCIENEETRKKEYGYLLEQSILVDKIKQIGGKQ